MSKFGNAALAAASLLAIILFLTFDRAGSPWICLVAKLVPVSALLIWLTPPKSGHARLVYAGLMLSLAGDALLALPGEWFLPGLVAFLVAHLCYIAAFLDRRRAAEWPRLLPFAMWVGGVYLFLVDHLGAMAAPVGIYSLVITVMMWRAAALVERPARRWQLAAAIGATLFGLSDSTLAVMRFHGAVPFGATFLILAYWAGQAGIAFSVVRE